MVTSAHLEPSSPRISALPQGKLTAVQGLRAVAVLLVVWTHSIVAASYYSSPKQNTFFHLRGFGACGLDIFFVISGFIVSLVAARGVQTNGRSARIFLSRRITRIFPLYWILTLVIILEAQLGTHPILWHRVPWLPTLLLLPGWHYPIPPPILSLGWSLLFEIYFYLVLAAWMRWTPRHLVRNTVAFLAAMVALGSIVGIHRPVLVIWSSPVAVEFIFGCLIGQVYLRSRTAGGLQLQSFSPRLRPFGPWIAAVGALALMVTVFTGYGVADEASSILAGLGGWLRLCVWGAPSGLLVLGTVLWSPAMQSPVARLMVFLGDASYSIYLCTNPARSLVEHFWRYFGRWGGDVGVLLCLLVCVVIGLLCYLVVERPLMRVFHNWNKQVPFSSRTTP